MHVKFVNRKRKENAFPFDPKSRRHRQRVPTAAFFLVTDVTRVVLHWQISLLCLFARHTWFSCFPHRFLCDSVVTSRATFVCQLSSTPLGVVSQPLRHARHPSKNLVFCSSNTQQEIKEIGEIRCKNVTELLKFQQTEPKSPKCRTIQRGQSGSNPTKSVHAETTPCLVIGPHTKLGPALAVKVS